jgi:hypothetical protein
LECQRHDKKEKGQKYIATSRNKKTSHSEAVKKKGAKKCNVWQRHNIKNEIALALQEKKGAKYLQLCYKIKCL